MQKRCKKIKAAQGNYMATHKGWQCNVRSRNSMRHATHRNSISPLTISASRHTRKINLTRMPILTVPFLRQYRWTKAQKSRRTKFDAEFWNRFCVAWTNSFGQGAKIPRKKRLFLFLFWTSKKGKRRKNNLIIILYRFLDPRWSLSWAQSKGEDDNKEKQHY